MGFNDEGPGPQAYSPSSIRQHEAPAYTMAGGACNSRGMEISVDTPGPADYSPASARIIRSPAYSISGKFGTGAATTDTASYRVGPGSYETSEYSSRRHVAQWARHWLSWRTVDAIISIQP